MIDLKTREKKTIAIVAAVLLATLFQIAIVSPSVEKRDKLDRSIRDARIQLQQLRMLEREYSLILGEMKRIRRQMGAASQSFELLPFLSQTATKLDLKSNLASMKSSRRELSGDLAEDMVQLELQGVSLENLVDYLHKIEEAGPAIAVVDVRITSASKRGGGLTVRMLVTTISSG